MPLLNIFGNMSAQEKQALTNSLLQMSASMLQPSRTPRTALGDISSALAGGSQNYYNQLATLEEQRQRQQKAALEEALMAAQLNQILEKPEIWEDWGFGQKREKKTGKIEKVPVKPEDQKSQYQKLGQGDVLFDVIQGKEIARGLPKDERDDALSPFRLFKDTKRKAGWTDEQIDAEWQKRQERMKQIIPQITVSTPFVSEETGTPLVMDRSGNIRPAKVTPGVTPSIKPSAEMIKAESEIANMEGALSRIDSTYKSDYVGPVAGRIAAVQEKLTGLPEQQATFYADVRSVKDALLRAKSGAQINEQEYARMTKFLPNENDPPSIFQARMKRFKQELSTIKTGRQKAKTGKVKGSSNITSSGNRFTIKEK